MSDISKIDWHQSALDLKIKSKAFIGGQFTDSVSGQTFTSISPIDGRTLAEVAACDVEDVNIAVKSARKAFKSGDWSNRTPVERKAILQNFAQIIRNNRNELALLETLDMGKPIANSTSIDVNATANCFDWYAESIDKIYGEIAPTANNYLALVTREPLGVVAAVVPWNFPMLMAAWKLAPALAAGNSIILKPAEQSSLTALKLAELAVEAGIPQGVFNVVTGYGPEVGRALGMHMDIDGLFFTGSTQVGKYFMEYAAKSNLKTIGLELGGKSPFLLLESYKDTKRAATTVANSIFFNQGEMCTAPSRLIVERSVHEEAVETIVNIAKSLIPNNPLNAQTKMGAMVDVAHTERVMNFVNIAEKDGADVVIGGKQTRIKSGGCYIEPTVFDNVKNNMRVAQDEIFGPMLSIIPVDSVDEAIQVANDSPYGLASSVWTNDLNTAHTVSRKIHAGIVYVNCYDVDDMTTPFGGVKQSGIGRDKSLHALDKFTEIKSTWISLDI
ncbi:MAG: aldehyde dehydrogenase [Rhizobiales bacterium]|nr:aldehyde dehydrogenase [Hyphomicrobiales bacterium]